MPTSITFSYKIPVALLAPIPIRKAVEELCYRASVPTVKWNCNLSTISGSSGGARTLPKVLFRSRDKEVSEGAKRGDNRSADANAKRRVGQEWGICHQARAVELDWATEKQAQHLHKQGSSISSTAAKRSKKKSRNASHLEQ